MCCVAAIKLPGMAPMDPVAVNPGSTNPSLAEQNGAPERDFTCFTCYSLMVPHQMKILPSKKVPTNISWWMLHGLHVKYPWISPKKGTRQEKGWRFIRAQSRHRLHHRHLPGYCAIVGLELLGVWRTSNASPPPRARSESSGLSHVS